MEHISVFLITVVGLILLLAGFHAINAIATNSNRESGAAINPDELDKLIELGAAKWGGGSFSSSCSNLVLVCDVECSDRRNL